VASIYLWADKLPYEICNALKFSPSLSRETSVFLYTALFPTSTMTSADFS